MLQSILSAPGVELVLSALVAVAVRRALSGVKAAPGGRPVY